jgi:hypothetical protein
MIWGGQQFFNDSMRKYITVFGKMFDNTTIIRETANAAGGNSTNKIETVAYKVPFAYAAKDKMFVRLTQDPQGTRPEAVILPRMSFEVAGSLTYDGDRKLTSSGRNVKANTSNFNVFMTQYNPVPYNIPFNLYIYSKFQEDGFKLLEPILSYFTPEFTPQIQLIPSMDVTLDVPIVIGNPTLIDTFDGKAPDRRLLVWTVPFIMKGYFFGPIIERPMIKFANVHVYAGAPYSNIGWGLNTSQFTNSTQTTISLYSNGQQASFPQVGNSTTPYFARIDNELIVVTAGFGTNTLTISRGEANTLANAHAAGAVLTPVVSNNFAEYVYTQPGLLANGAATNVVANSIPWANIYVFDDYGYATEIFAAGTGD